MVCNAYCDAVAKSSHFRDVGGWWRTLSSQLLALPNTIPLDAEDCKYEAQTVCLNLRAK